MYYAGSTTKSFTAAAISLLIDDTANSSDPIKWITPISSLIRDDFVLPDEYATAHVTLEDAASHRTGMPRHDGSYGKRNDTVQSVARSLRHLPMTAEIRTRWQYCNIMFKVLSHVVETVIGMWLGDFLRTRIWEPLSMSSTYFSLQDAENAVNKENKSLARGYFWDNHTQRYIPENWCNDPTESGDGAIISTVADYAKYLHTMIDQAPPISPAGHAALRTPRSFADLMEHFPNTGPTTYGLAWFRSTYRGESMIYHGGAMQCGFGTQMLYLPWRKWGVVIMANTFQTSNLAEEILQYALLDDLMDTPRVDRIDWQSRSDTEFERRTQALDHIREEWYPNAPKPPIPTTLSLSHYTGLYTNPAYGTFNVTLHIPNPELLTPAHTNEILRIELTDRGQILLDFEHISSDFFLAWLRSVKTDGSLALAGAAKAAFTINEAGEVDELGLGIEPEMVDEKIWAKKVM
ncbi:hypothetical protein MMC12_005949 [Toensbergia leucococca]|nr:hypothetical protein [Toensbergia leucococca]